MQALAVHWHVDNRIPEHRACGVRPGMCQDYDTGCDRSGLRFAHNTPSIEFDSFDEYVQLVVQARSIYHELLVTALSFSSARGGSGVRLKQSWTHMRREGVRALLHATKCAAWAAGWAHDANDMIVISLRATAHAYMSHARDVVADELSLILASQLDFLLGYPDCCWGWGGGGGLRDMLRTSFYAIATPSQMNIVSKSQWPLHGLALLMATHRRLGAGCGLRDCDSELFRVLLGMVLSPPAPQVHHTVIE